MNCILDLYRNYYRDNYTIGRLFVNGQYYCDTLEPSKVHPTHPCIKAGTYDVRLDRYSPRLGNKTPYKTLCAGRVPLLVNVPNREYILIHIGNTPEDTNGCILIGYNTIKGKVLNSTRAFTRLRPHLDDPFYDNVIINIVDMPLDPYVPKSNQDTEPF